MRAHRTPSPRAVLPVALLAVGFAAGCATEQSRRDAYDRSLAHWQGAPVDALVASWGQPRFEQEVEGGKLMTYVTDHVAGYDNRPTVSFGLGGWNWGGGSTSVGAGVGVTTPVGSSASANGCTTHFLVSHGKVESWTFEGGGCGASAL
jgi:hypothetical protein